MPFPPTHPALARALSQQGYDEPTPVQAAVLDAEPNRDLLVSAQTGSGKTVAFGLALASSLLGDEERFGQPAAPLALIIAPTRELALQVARELGWLYGPAGVEIVTCVGGMDARREARALSQGAHIVVGTPGRLRDHLERGALDLSGLAAVVLDEADEMLDLGFREDLEEILDATPAARRTLLFSATIAKDIAALARRYQRDALRIDTVRRDEPHGDIEYRAVRVAPNEIERAVVNILRYFESPGALVFCATRENVRKLYGALRERGFSAVALSGEMTQKERSDALQALRDGHARACVATDVAARGLDLPDLGLVIHADLPANKAALLHRSGRTGRAGRKGVSVLIAPFHKQRLAQRMLESASVEAYWSGPPSAEDIRAKDEQRMLDDPLLAEAPSDDDLAMGQRLLEGRAPEAVAAAFIRLYRQRLPEPEEMFNAPDRPPPAPAAKGQRTNAYEPLAADSGASWFRMRVGRANNADPKWLIPLICRLGHVTKKDIGQIRIFDRETKFEIAAEAVDRFRDALSHVGEDEVRIEPAGAPEPRPARSGPRSGPSRSGPPRSGPPRSAPPRGGKPFKGPPRGKSNAAGKGPPRKRPS